MIFPPITNYQLPTKRAFTLIELMVVIAIVALTSVIVITGASGNLAQTNLIQTGELVKNEIQHARVKTVSGENNRTKITFSVGDTVYITENTTFEIPYHLAVVRVDEQDYLTLQTDTADTTTYTLIQQDRDHQLIQVTSIQRDEQIPVFSQVGGKNLKLDQYGYSLLYVLPPTTSGDENTTYNTLTIQTYDSGFDQQATVLTQINGSAYYQTATIELFPNLQTVYTVWDNTAHTVDQLWLTLQSGRSGATTTLIF